MLQVFRWACVFCPAMAKTALAGTLQRPHGSGVEHSLGKGEVVSSNLTVGTIFLVFSENRMGLIEVRQIVFIKNGITWLRIGLDPVFCIRLALKTHEMRAVRLVGEKSLDER